jgi:2-polyprenyl-6-methoxyphenol hydroxylase-like FAD-dependent oxidoreductase
LTLAGLLLRDGHRVTVLERGGSFVVADAGIVLAPHAVRVLSELDVVDTLRTRGYLPETTILTDQHGRELSKLDAQDGEHLFGRSLAVRRAVLHESLLGVLMDGVLVAGVTPEDITEDGNRVRIVCSDGESRAADVLVGADWIRSAVRRLVFNGATATYSRYTCWRFVVEHSPQIRRAVEMSGAGR